MSSARAVSVSVALCTLLIVAAVAVGLASPGIAGGNGQGSSGSTQEINTTDKDTDDLVSTNFSGVDEPGNTTAVPQQSLLDRRMLPERGPDNQTYRSIVIFRNDDIQSGYRPETMRAVDEVFIEEDVPVTLGVIPRMAGDNITETKTCSYLTQLKRDHPKLFEFSLHGYKHTDRTGFYGGSEFGNLPAGEQDARIAHGKAIMQRCTGLSPQSFVPPFNTYDANTTAALRANGIDTISAGGWFTNQYYNRTESGAFVARDVVHIPSTSSFIQNWTTNEFYSQEHLRQQFDQAYENRSLYVSMLHYSSFNTTEKRDRLREVIRYMKGHDDVKFMTVAEFGRATREGTLTKTSSGWRYSNATANAPTSTFNSSPMSPNETLFSNTTAASPTTSLELRPPSNTTKSNQITIRRNSS